MSYRDSHHLGQSSLKLFLGDPADFLEQESRSSNSLTTGSAVDILLLTPDKFQEEFAVFDAVEPSENVKPIITELYKRYEDLPMMDFPNQVIQIAREQGYRAKHSDEVILKNAWGPMQQDYFNMLQASKDKVVIDSNKFKQCEAIVNLIKEDKNYQYYISNNKDVLYQHDIYWTYKDVPLKALLDIVVFDHKNKKIYPYDLKTTSESTLKFGKTNSFWKYRYDIQASYYTEGLKALYPGYTIMPFRFIVTSTVKLRRPRFFEVTQDILDIGRNGGIREGKYYEGWEALLNKYIWHSKNNIWDITQEEYEHKGILQLTL